MSETELPAEPKPKDHLPKRCDLCTMWLHTDTTCHRRAPSQINEPLRIVKWPLKEAGDRCGAGSTQNHPIRCGLCVHAWQPDGVPLTPRSAGAWASPAWNLLAPVHDPEWWLHSALCTNHAPVPGLVTNPRVYHGVVNLLLDGCGDGEVPPEAPDQGAG